MTDASIQKILRRANNSVEDDLIQTLPISPAVSFAKVWTGKQWSNPAAFGIEPYTFYFIKNKESEYVAAILDMTSDLHWYVTPKHRKKGHLTKALNEVILPYILKDREEQRITISQGAIGKRNFDASEKVAFSVGFTKSENNEYILSNKTSHHLTEQPRIPLTADRMKVLQERLSSISSALELLQTEVHFAYGNNDVSETIEYLRDDLTPIKHTLADLWYDELRAKKSEMKVSNNGIEKIPNANIL